MRNPSPFPTSLRGRAISTRDAPDWGLSERRTRARDVAHPYHGVFGVDLALASVLDRCRAYEPRLLDGQLFSHVTALALWGGAHPAGPR